jgi:hypothetical protein
MSLDPSTSTATTTAQERQPVRSWPRALPAVFQYATMTTPWATLLAGCLIGTGILWLLRYIADTSRSSVDQNTMRFTVLPAVAGLAFVPRAAFRPLVDATPVPAWLAPVAQTALALPALVLTCWLQLLLIHPNGPPGPIAHPPAIYPLLAQLTGWCALTLAIAVCTERSKYADLGGAVAAPAGLTLIALATYTRESATCWRLHPLARARQPQPGTASQRRRFYSPPSRCATDGIATRGASPVGDAE